MKIMLVSRVTAKHRSGGMPHVVSDRATALAAAGHEVHVVTTSGGPKSGVSGMVDGVLYGDGTVYHYTMSPAHEWTVEFARECRRMAKELKPDIIHLESFDRVNDWWANLPDPVQHLAVTMHGFGWGAFLTQWNLFRVGAAAVPPRLNIVDLLTEAKALSKFSTVIGVSAHEERMLIDEYGLGNKVHRVYNPLPSYFFDYDIKHNYRPAGSCYRSGFLCAAVSQGGTRGFQIAQRAARIANVELKVVTNLKREQMPAVYDSVHAVVLPTAFGQGFDLAVCEARARGTPAIMSATGSYLLERTDIDQSVGVHNEQDLVKAMLAWKSGAPIYDANDHRITRHKPGYHARAWLDAVLHDS